MSVHARSEFALALNQLCEERNISAEAVVETIKNAVLAAFRKEASALGSPIDIHLYMSEVNPETGESRIFKKIIKDEEAQEFEKGEDVTPPGFGRIAAQTAKQVILQKIREAEKQAILTDYTAKIGSLVNGLVIRFDHGNVVVDIGKSEAVMPPPEQVYAEHYRLNQRMVFYLAGIKETPRGSIVIVSRTNTGLIEALFRREIPEVQNGTVKIKNIVREPGIRTKVAVETDKKGVDPIGACVGQKGVRVQAILKELGTSERIDLVLFSENTVEYIRSALAPAKSLNIMLDEKSKTARVAAPEDQLSLAIGAKGQNAGLAGRLTGWKIDIESEEEEKQKSKKIEDVATQKKVVNKKIKGEAARKKAEKVKNPEKAEEKKEKKTAKKVKKKAKKSEK